VLNHAEVTYEDGEITATVASGNYASEGGNIDGTISGNLVLADFPAFSNIDIDAQHEDNSGFTFIDDLLLTEEVCD
jgi:hypothetical protein